MQTQWQPLSKFPPPLLLAPSKKRRRGTEEGSCLTSGSNPAPIAAQAAEKSADREATVPCEDQNRVNEHGQPRPSNRSSYRKPESRTNENGHTCPESASPNTIPAPTTSGPTMQTPSKPLSKNLPLLPLPLPSKEMVEGGQRKEAA